MRKQFLLLSVLFLWAICSFGQSAPVHQGKTLPNHQLVSLPVNQQQYTSLVASGSTPAGNTFSPQSPEAWITPWNFAQTSGTYTAISGGTSIGATTDDEQVFGPYAIGFNFSYNGTVYTQFSVSTNGFIGLGSTVVTTSSTPISTGTSNNIISALGGNLAGQTGSDLQYLLTGSSPNRTLVVQWTNYRKSAATGDVFNFQIRLTETSNVVAVVYNSFTVNSTNSTVEVGLRGASTSDYNNRSVAAAQTWATSIAGTTAASNCRLRTATKPANGQTYTWTPVICNTITTYPYNEDFSATLNPCWSASTVTGTNNWTMATSITYPDNATWAALTPQSGSYLAAFDSYNATAGNQARLKTATFDFTSLTNPSIEFYMSQDPGYTNGDSINIQVSTNGGSTWTTLYPAFKRYNSSLSLPGWTKCIQYLPAYASMNNVIVGFLATSRYGNKMAIDNVTVKQGLLHDVGSVGIWAATKLPKGQDFKWWTFNKNYAPTTETFDVDTKLIVGLSPVVTNTNTVTALAYNVTKTLNGSYNLSSYAVGSSFTISNLTKLGTDQNTSNDLLVNSARPCVNDTIYAWDDGVAESAVGYNTTTGYLGQSYYITTQDTLTSISIEWGTITGALAGNSIEIYNVVGGVPTTKFADIKTGISLTAASTNTWATYKPSSPIILPVGTYWIGVHQSVALAGTYIVATDETGLTNDNFLTGWAFGSGTGALGTWFDYSSSGIPVINMIRPNFANIYIPFVANPGSVVATPVSSTEIDLSWALNANGNNVLVAYNTTNTFGSPLTGTTYSAGNSIPGGGTVLQYGSGLSYHHTGLSPTTTYYYKLWSYAAPNYSGGADANATTLCGETPSPWSQNFETATFPPTCWDVNTGGNTWVRSTAASGYATGSASAMADFYNTASATPFALFSLPFNKGSLLAPRLSFDYSYATYTDGSVDELDIFYSTDGGVTFTLLKEMPGGISGILNTAGTSSSQFVPTTAAQWKTANYFLPAGTNMVAFDAISGYGNNLYIDNIQTIEGPGHDVGISSVNPVDVYQPGTTSPVVTVCNFGGNTETFTVTLTIGSYTSTKTVTAMAATTTQQVTFDPWTAVNGNYTFSVSTTMSGDQDASNNTVTKPIRVMALNKQVYGYTTFSTTDNGPITFNLATPGTITEIVNEYPVVTYPASGTWANGTWYATIYAAAAPYNLVTFDPATGARTVIGNMGVNINAMSYNTANSTMYGAGWDGTNSLLYTINLSTGTATLVGTIGTRLIINMAINNAGVCYVTDLTNSLLGTLNLTTAAFTSVGSIGFTASYAQDMEFDRETNELYMAAYGSTGQLRWVDQSTGNTLLIGNFQGGAEVTGFAIPYSTNKTINLTGVRLEGLYAGIANPMNQAADENGPHWPAGVADHITVELHSASAYSTTVYSVSDVALSTSGSATVTVPGAMNGSYYLTIKHRNSIETVSANPVSFSGSTVSQSFATPADVYNGNLLSFEDGGFAIYGGDTYQDGLIDGSDLAAVDNQASAFAAGYIIEDCNGDGLIDGSDLAIADNNASAFVGAATP